MNRTKYDVYIAVGILLILAMMIIPLPVPMLDFFMSLNLMFSLAVILVVIYSKKTTDFTVFPSMLLLSTLFTLALNISSTRLILTRGAAFNGKVIRAFSGFVVGTSGIEGLVVGFIIFIILIAVQVIVITKGSSRIAEVSARFTLDGMVQKNMAVDSQISSGAVSPEEGQLRKDAIQQEADFYSAMDGASKFVSGSVRVGILITVVNILGGLCVGVFLRGEGFKAACSTYISFSVGDGLVSQIPALLVSAASALIVTRSNTAGSFGDNIVREFSKDWKIYWIIGVFMVILGIIPGFNRAWYVFIPLAFLAFYIGNSIKCKATENKTDSNEKVVSSVSSSEKKHNISCPVSEIDPVTVELGCGISFLASNRESHLLGRIEELRDSIVQELGFLVPGIRFRDSVSIRPNEYVIKTNEVESARFSVVINRYLAVDENCNEDVLENGIETTDPVNGKRGFWILPDENMQARNSGYVVLDIPSLVLRHLDNVIRNNISELFSREHAMQLMDVVKKNSPGLHDEVLKNFSVGEIHKVLSSLLEEQVSIRNIVLICQILEDNGTGTHDCELMVETVRQGLKRQISHSVVSEDKKIHCTSLAEGVEEKVKTFASEPLFAKKFREVADAQKIRVLVCSPDIRLCVKKMVGRGMTVLSFLEISDDVVLSQDGQIRL